MTSPWPPAWPKSKKASSYWAKDSERIILHLTKVEMRLRKEISQEQVYRWSKEEIRKVYG